MLLFINSLANITILYCNQDRIIMRDVDFKENEEFLVEERKTEQQGRITWRHPLEFVLNVVGYMVGLGNVWRFSYLCYKNGGGAFLIPYCMVATLCGLPLVFQEVAMGQFTKHGCIGAWDISPIMRGVGYAGMMLSLYYTYYFMLVMAWCMFYLVHSFTTGQLPWSTCDNAWNTDSCIPTLQSSNHTKTFLNTSSLNESYLPAVVTTSTEEFWNNYVLQKTEGLEDLGSFTNWRMLLCYLFSWLICYLCIAKGIRTTGKVAYFTVIAPYIMMLILLVRGVTLEGAGTGIMFYLTPTMEKLGEPTVWLDAGSQVLMSLGVGYSVLYGFGSYNHFNFDCYKYAFVFVGICCGSSLFVGFVVFSFIGHIAFKQGVGISDVAEGGPGLIFEVYPTGVTLLPVPQLWSVIFFLMLVFVAIDSVFGTIEGCITLLADLWPKKFSHGKHRYRIGLCLTIAAAGLVMIFDGGIYVFEIVNNYGASGICILFVALFESIAIGWVYGVDKFYEDIKSMIGYYPNVFFKYCYKYIAPLVTMFIFVFHCAKYAPLRIGNYDYPWWGNLLGWFLSLSVVLCIPGFAFLTFIQTEGTWKERWKQCTTSRLHRQSGKEKSHPTISGSDV